jgi:hypothetical protein
LTTSPPAQLERNPALSVKAPCQKLSKGKTAVLTAEEPGDLLQSINTDTAVGLRDRALIGVMVFTFACGARNAPAQKFCGECGARLGSGASSRKFSSPDAYTPKHLAEKILTSKTALEGERKQVTVLFADLKPAC